MQEKHIIKYVLSLDPSLFNLPKISSIKCQGLGGGLHNLNFKLTVSDGLEQCACVLRIPDSNKNSDALANENYYIQLLKNSEVTPKILLYAQDTTLNRPTLITEFIEGEHIQFDNLNDSQIKLLARKLVAIHSIQSQSFSTGNAQLPETKGVLKDYAEATIREKITERYEVYSKDVDHDSVTVNRAQSLLNNMLSENNDSSWNLDNFSLCHGDIGAGNILWTGEDLRFIDWDDARFGDPADDIAYIFAINHLGSNFQRTFLQAYIENSKEISISSRIDVYVFKNYLFDVVWAIGKLYQAKNESSFIKVSENEYREMYDQRLSSLKTYMESLEI